MNNSAINGDENQIVGTGEQENRAAKLEEHIDLPEAPRTCKQRCCFALKESCTSPHIVVRELVTEFGWQLMIMLMCGYLLVKGSLYTFIATGMLPYFKSINVTGTAYQRYNIAALTPWSMKALFGAISDAIPLCGYGKSVYILLSSTFGIVAFTVLSAVSLTTDEAPVAAVLFFFGSLQLAVVDLLCEGRYAALMVEKPETGASIVTWVWMCYQVGSLLSAIVIGPLSDSGNVNLIFWVCLPLSAQIVIPVALGFLGENPMTRRDMRVEEEKAVRLLLEGASTTDVETSVLDADQDWIDKSKMDVYSSFRTTSVNGSGAPVNSSYGTLNKDEEEDEDDEEDADISIIKQDTCLGGKNKIVPLCCREYGTGLSVVEETRYRSVDSSNTSVPRVALSATKSFDESLMRRAPCCSIRCAKIRAQPQLFALALIMAAGSFGLSVVSLAQNDELQLAYSLLISAFLCALGFLWLPTMLAKVNLYMFLQDVFYVQIYGAIDYFYTARPACVKDGPHFDYTFYASWSGVVGSVAGWLGVILFQVVMGNWKFRHVFWVTTVVRVCASLIDVVIIERWNERVGIDDKVMYMLGDNIIYQLCYMMNFMPAVVLTSKVCPKSMEATIYALLAGFQNFGQSVAASIGIYAIKAFNITTSAEDGESCNFNNLSLMVVICHFALPLVAIPLTFVLIPDARLTEEVEVNEKILTGSQAWCGKLLRCCGYHSDVGEQQPRSPGAVSWAGFRRGPGASVYDNNYTRRALLLRGSKTM